MSVYHSAWAGSAIVLIVTGGTFALLGLSPGLVALATVIGLISGALVSMVDGPGEPLTLGRRLPAAAAGFTSVMVGAGLGAVAGPIGPAAVVLMVAVSPAALQRYAALRWYAALRLSELDRMPPESGHPVGRSHPRATKLTNPTSSLGPMTDQELCLTWRRSCAALAHAARPADHLAVVEARAAYLDELQRRDPVGFACWIAASERVARDPARYLGKHPS